MFFLKLNIVPLFYLRVDYLKHLQLDSIIVAVSGLVYQPQVYQKCNPRKIFQLKCP